MTAGRWTVSGYADIEVEVVSKIVGTISVYATLNFQDLRSVVL